MDKAKESGLWITSGRRDTPFTAPRGIPAIRRRTACGCESRFDSYGLQDAGFEAHGGDDLIGPQLFLRSSFRMLSSASMISSREARLFVNDSFRLNALVGGRKANT
jgi:hypothetical protein